jgi:hypothetical protein
LIFLVAEAIPTAAKQSISIRKIKKSHNKNHRPVHAVLVGDFAF